MKKILYRKHFILILFTIFPLTGFSQETQIIKEMTNDIDIAKTTSIPREFDTKFKSEDKSNFKKLRFFLYEKEELLKRLNLIIDANKIDINEQNTNLKKIKELNNLIIGKKPNDIIDMRNYIYNRVSPPPKETVEEIVRQIKIFEYTSNQNEQKIKENQSLEESINNIKQDIRDCQNEIDTALDPENRKQEFKTMVSKNFVYLIGFILLCFFSIIYLKSDLSLSKDLLSGYGLQFITLFVLIIAIILFGILDILKGSELAAMLSGISGYILGKGIQDKKLITENNNLATIVPPVVTETTITNVNPELNPL